MTTGLYSLLKFPALFVFRSYAQLVRMTCHDPSFYDTKDFPWAKDIESNFLPIKKEIAALLEEVRTISNFQEIYKDQGALTEGDDWKAHILYAYGNRIKNNCDQCPATDAFLRRVPNLRSAMFSILAPGKHIPAHRGPFKDDLRFHLGLIVPGAPNDCRLRVDEETRSWQEGKGFIFDDAQEHEAWNDSDGYRAILFVDFKRPLPIPLNFMGEALYQLFRRTPIVQNIIKNL